MSGIASALDLLVRASPAASAVVEKAIRGASTDAPILILGESGTGRTTLARALHDVSRRREGPLVEVDPAALPASLFESELFGHVAGAFTGADSRVLGRVERAEGGSLLFDHVEETPVSVQAKLLRLLAEQRYAPLGGRDRHADVRFLAIGSDDLQERVAVGVFRSDLFYRLEVVTLRLPPLRERMSDLSTLLDHFVDDLAERLGRRPPAISTRARSWMNRYTWPGNLRELRNVLEREMLVLQGDMLDPAPPESRMGEPRRLIDVEREEIVRALQHTRGHQGRAAEILGISRKSLWERRRRFGLS